MVHATNSTTATWQNIDHAYLSNNGTNTHPLIDASLQVFTNSTGINGKQTGVTQDTEIIPIYSDLNNGSFVVSTLSASYQNISSINQLCWRY